MESEKDLFVIGYSLVSNRRGGWNSKGGWKKSQKLIAGGVGIIGGLEKISVIRTFFI